MFYFNFGNSHLTIPSSFNVEQLSAGSHTIQIRIPTGVIVDTQDYAYMSVIETMQNGLSGSSGTSGTSGTNGPIGASGSSGTSGTSGSSGTSVLTTVTGVTSTGDLNVGGATTLSGSVKIGTPNGDEGGEINLAKPPNGTLSGGVTVDAYRDRLRIFEQGGSARGVSIDLSKAPTGVAGELTWKASGYVDAGQFVTLDNLKFTVTTSGNRGLSCATVSGTSTLAISATFGYISGVGGQSTNGGSTYTYNTTVSSSLFGWSFPNAGDGATYLINDTTNNRFYRVTMMIGPGYNNNFICIERL